MGLIAFVVFGSALVAAVAAAAGPLHARWQRVVRLASGQVDLPLDETPRERWGRVHLQGDRRRPFHRAAGRQR